MPSIRQHLAGGPRGLRQRPARGVIALVGVGLSLMSTVAPSAAQPLNMLPEAADARMRRFAIFFDFDTDSCYPSPAISPAGVVNGGMSVTQIDPSFVQGCREPAQLTNATTYHRRAVITKDGVTYSVRMYALYFMKDKDLPLNQAEGGLGHRHDWEFALVWTTNDRLTHAYVSQHRGGELRPVSALHFDAWCPDCVKVVYHKDGGTTHNMRFAEPNEKAENHTRYWVQPPIVDWWLMPTALRSTLNGHRFGQADCSVCDARFPYAISENPPPGYPGKEEWIQAARRPPLKPDLTKKGKPR